MGETVGDAPPVTKAKPTILVPPRGLLFANGSGPGFSPGPMTLVSSFFPEHGPFSFSQLLAGTMSSPPTAAQPQPQSFSPLFMVPPGLNLTGFLNSPGYLSPLQSPFGMSHQQALAHVTAQAALSQSFKQMQAEFYHSLSTHPSDPSANHSLDTLTQNPTSNHLSPEPDSSKSEPISETSPSDKSPADKPANDGYNWRKYGQKQVKASECPRSYYKCSNLSCPVKKKVGRALDGHVTEVTYKGEHNHDVPKHNKRAKDSCASDKTNVASQDRIEINGLKEAINSNNIDKEDNAIIVDKGDEDEPIAKKRSVEIVTASSHQVVSESKIVLQTRSEVDLLDDGYKWRKYGQKVVKGNPYPRSYYRCTYAGCNVRKHVERASVDPKAVITTYEGKHNHDIPTGRHMGAQQLTTQKKTKKEEINRGDDKDNNIPVTLQLKE